MVAVRLLSVDRFKSVGFEYAGVATDRELISVIVFANAKLSAVGCCVTQASAPVATAMVGL
jgi:hypothetical protein